jgi:hypothetical protein
MSSLIECVGFPASRLTDDQRAKVHAVIDAVPVGDLIAVRLFPNLDTRSEEDLPSGMQLVMKASAKVDPTLISDNMFQVMAVSKVYPDKTRGQDKDTYYEHPERVAALQQSVQQFSPHVPELGGPEGLVGVYSRLRENHRDKDHYIVARGTVPILVQNLKKKIGDAPTTPTYRDLLHKEEWHRAVQNTAQAARRNVFRNIASAAEALEVNVDRIDDLAVLPTDPNYALAEMAVPEWEQATHSIDIGGGVHVVLSYGVVPAQDCLQLKDGQFFVVGAEHISVYKLSQHERISSAMGVPAAEAAVELATVTTNAADFRAGMQHVGWNAVDHVSVLVPLAVKTYDTTLKRK